MLSVSCYRLRILMSALSSYFATKVFRVDVVDPIIDIQLQHESLPCVKTFIDPRQRWVQEKVKQIL
uniref:Uncharacterized protein n=1 Tax=Sinocyclocheilus rhinocerous TaxID=307959 RepID=A0A673MU56_9TELE